MHVIICAIVSGKDEEEALKEAKSTFECLVREGNGTFDYYTTFDEESPVSGKSRWGELPVVVKIDNPVGKKLIDDLMRATRNEFGANLIRVRRLFDNFNLTNEELFEGTLGMSDEQRIARKLTDASEKDLRSELSSARYCMHQLGQYEGSAIRLYSSGGGGIRNNRDLEATLSCENGPVWVVPADVHY